MQITTLQKKMILTVHLHTNVLIIPFLCVGTELAVRIILGHDILKILRHTEILKYMQGHKCANEHVHMSVCLCQHVCVSVRICVCTCHSLVPQLSACPFPL